MTDQTLSTLRRLADIREKIGMTALFAFALSAWQATGIAHAALVVMVLAFPAEDAQSRRILLRDPLLRLSLIFLVYVLAAAAWAAHRWPGTAHQQWAAVWPWSSLSLFIVVAWWIKGSWRRVSATLLLAPLGLIAGILHRSDWSHLADGLAGRRYEFGFTALGLSFLALIIVIGCLCFLPRLTALARKTRHGVWLLLLVTFLFGFFLFVLLSAQSRGAWVSLAFALLLLGASGLTAGTPDKSRLQGARHALPMLLFVGLFGLLAASQFGHAMLGRFSEEIGLVPQLFSADIATLPYSSGASRIHLAAWGARLFVEHPLIGWGPGTSATQFVPRLLFPEPPATGFLSVIKHFAHLHNAFMEVAVRFGSFGILLFGTALTLFSKSLRDRSRIEPLPGDFLIFARVVLLTTLFLSLYEFRLLHTDFRFFALLFGGSVYTFTLWNRPPAPAGEAQPGTGPS